MERRATSWMRKETLTRRPSTQSCILLQLDQSRPSAIDVSVPVQMFEGQKLGNTCLSIVTESNAADEEPELFLIGGWCHCSFARCFKFGVRSQLKIAEVRSGCKGQAFRVRRSVGHQPRVQTSQRP